MNLQFEKIADGLAVQGYGIIDSFLNTDEIAGLLQFDEFKAGLLQFQKAGIGKLQGRKINETIRGDYVRWVDRETAAPALKVFLTKLDELMVFLNQSLFLSLKDFEMHLTIYPPGTKYQRHLDQFKYDDHRRLSVLLYLNENWKEEHGGQLRMFLPGGPLDILPIAGRLVCFRSDQIEHEVRPATRDRLSITGWMLDRPAGLKHL